MKFFGSLCILAVGNLLVAAVASADYPLPLHNISAGTQLVAEKPVIIPANADEILLSNRAGNFCRLRVRDRKPFDRLIDTNQPLTVAKTSRSAFSSSRRSSVTTYVELKSKGLEDLACVADRGSHEMTITEFQNLLAGEFSLKPTSEKPVLID